MSGMIRFVVDDCYKRYKNGESVSKMSKDLGRGKDYLSRKFKEKGYEYPLYIPKIIFCDLVKIFNRYEYGESLVDISKDYDLHWATIYKYLIKNNFKITNRVKNIGKDVEKYIVDNYYNMQNKTLIKKTGVSGVTLNKIIKKHKLKLKGSGVVRPPFDINKFNTPEGQYIIGYVLGDGSVTYNKQKRNYTLSINTIDIDTVENFKIFFKDYLKIYPEKTLCINCKPITCMHVNDRNMVKYLISIGITPKKADNCRLKIPLNWDIVRGYLDADGYVAIKTNFAKITSNSIKSLQDVCRFTGFGKVRKRSKEKTYDWKVSNYVDLKNLYNNLYYEGCMHMRRKKERMRKRTQ